VLFLSVRGLSRDALPRLRDSDRGHPGSGRGLDADLGVLEDEAAGGVDAEARGGQKEGFRVGLASGVVAGADQGVEES